MSEDTKPEVKRYSKRLKTEEVVIEDEDGREEIHTLRELNGTLRDKFLNNQAARVKMKNGVEVRDHAGAAADLLSKCLYNSHGELVAAKEVDSWPSDMQMDIFMQAIKLSGLNRKAEEEEKNA